MTSGSIDLSVIIPTLNRCSRLAETLDAITRQDDHAASFELIVVDNGSTDDTLDYLRSIEADYPHPITVLSDDRPGQASAKNTGAGVARGDFLLFIGDDNAPVETNLFENHVKLHRSSGENVMLVGLIDWDYDRPVTEFMKWIGWDGLQFGYGRIKAGPVDPSRYMYGSHSSLKRSLFERVGGFNSSFSDLYDDIELGDRLGRTGAILIYHPELKVLHDHPTSVDQSLYRMERAGRSAYLYHQLVPEHPHPDVKEPKGLKRQLLLHGEPVFRLLPGKRALLARHFSRYTKGYRDAQTAARK